jgi:glycosidase
MPDLNYRNGDATLAMRDVIQFWLEEMGVDGFRLDAVRHLIENGAIQQNTPETHAWLQDFYRYVHNLSPEALTVGEVWDTSAAVAPYIGDELDICFEFDLAQAVLAAAKSGDAQKLVEVQQRVLDTYPRGQYASFLTNHDQNRVINQLLKNVDEAKIAATLLLTNPGVPFIYYGEEIGMRGVKPDERIRTPMQWDSSANAGFTSGTPWEALNNDTSMVNVAVLEKDPHSLFNHYRSLLHLRAEYAALRTGEMALVKSSTTQVYAFLRYEAGEAVLVLVNLSSAPVSGYNLSLAKGPLSGNPQAKLLYDEGQATAPSLNASGGFDSYQPLPELTPYGSYLIRLGAGDE